jgi:dynein heavy chain
MLIEDAYQDASNQEPVLFLVSHSVDVFSELK